jgi:DNA adenine methylase
MTSYQGGKKRIGKRIHAVIVELERILTGGNALPYFEPFVGMAGVLRHFAVEPPRKVTACDANVDLILMWQALQKGWKPPRTCTRAYFEELKHSKTHSPERAFIGTVASFGAIFFGRYRLHYENEMKRNYVEEGHRALLDIKPDLQRVRFLKARSYDKHHPTGKLVYCDPPYLDNRLDAKLFQNFDHDAFWEMMREWSRENLVVVSESSAPSDFKCIWETQSYLKNSSKAVKYYPDRLFVHKTCYDRLSPFELSLVYSNQFPDWAGPPGSVIPVATLDKIYDQVCKFQTEEDS